MQIKHSEKYLKINKIIAWILVIICISIACSLAAISGSHSFTNTYDCGRVCDLRGWSYPIELEYDNEDGNFFWVSTKEKPFNWNYLYLDLEGDDLHDISFELQCYNSENAVGNPISCIINEGYNKIMLNGDLCDSVMIKLTDNEVISFTVSFMEFRERELSFSPVQFMKYVILFVCILSLISILIISIFKIKKWHINWYMPIDFLQEVYIAFGNRLLWLSQRGPSKVKAGLRITALICWMFWIMFMYNTGKYLLSSYFKYNVLLFCITMLLIAISMIENKLKKVDWNKPLVHVWLWLSICMCISEFFISKRFCMIGYVNLTVFGFYYFVWNNLSDKNKIINEVMSAFKIAFLISVCFTLLFRPRNATYGLLGHTWNPNIYGIFCGIVLMVFLAAVRKHIMDKSYDLKFVVNLMGVAVSASFVLLAGSRAGILLVIPGMLFFAVEYVSCIRNKHIGVVRGVFCAVGFMALIFAVHMLMSWATVNLPIKQIVFSWDSYIPNEIQENMTVVGMEAPMIQKVAFNSNMTSFLTGRNYYWMGYLREINFFGHEYYPSMWGGARTPHNGILGIMYRYGILTIVPYILMFVNAVIIAFRKYIQDRNIANHSFYIWISVIGISLCMLIENFERPFLATEWLWWYWCIGFIFINESSTERHYQEV